MSSAATAGLCIHDEELDPLIQHFAEGSTGRGAVQVWEGDACDRPVPPAAKLTNPVVEVFFRPGEDPRQRSKAEKKQAEAAAKAIEVRGVGGKVELRLVDRNGLFVDPKNMTATFIYRVRVSRLQVSSAAAKAMDLDASADSPCRSVIQLTSRLSRGALALTKDKYRVSSDPPASELARLGVLDVEGLLGPRHEATFQWAPGTGGQSTPLTIVVDGPAGRQRAQTFITNKCAPPPTSEPEGPLAQEGLSTRVRLGYPTFGAGFGYDWTGDEYVWSYNFNYDYDYTRDEAAEVGGADPAPHMLTMSYRAGPRTGDVALLADVTIGVVLPKGALAFSPRFVVDPEGLPLQLGFGMLGIWDGGDESDTSGMAFVEWVRIW